MKSNIENQSFNQRAIEDQEDIVEISKIFNIGEQNQLPKLFHQLVKIYRPTDRNAIKSFAQQINDILDAEQHNTQQTKDIISNILKPSTLNKLLAGKYHKEKTVTRKIIESKLAQCWVPKEEIKKYLPNLHAKDAVSVDIMIANAQGKKLIVKEEKVNPNELSNVINGMNNGIKLVKLFEEHNRIFANVNNIKSAILDLLTNPNIDLTITNDNGCSPLHSAAHHGYLDVVAKLLEKGADIEAKDHMGYTALHSTAHHRYPDVLAKLLEKGADIEAKNHMGYTALHSAVRSQRIESVENLIDLGAYIDAKDNEDKTALHVAVGFGMAEVVAKLLEKGAYIDAKDNKGNTAVHLAAYHRYPGVLAKLLEKGADIEAKNKEGDTALHCVLFRFNFDPKVCEMIERYTKNLRSLEELDNQKLGDSEGSVQIDEQQQEVAEQSEVPIDTTDHNVNIQGGIDTNDTL